MELTVISVQTIWDQVKHSSMPDLIFFKNSWIASFRESDKHVHGLDGCIRLITSPDGTTWKTAALFCESGVDLRDPKLSVTPEGRLMLLYEGVFYDGDKYVTRQPRVLFSDDGVNWSPPCRVLQPHDWLWRVTWNEGAAWGISYKMDNPFDKNSEWKVTLYRSKNGIDYSFVSALQVYGRPSESTVRFDKEGRMIALVRRGKRGDRRSWIGSSVDPYTNWEWHEADINLGGPNFLILPDQSMITGGRLGMHTPYGYQERTILASMDFNQIRPRLFLPSAGDCSYPGMVYENGLLWVCYYSSHEPDNKSRIYLAKIMIGKSSLA